MENNQRQSNIELLRIITMSLLIAHHYAYHGLLTYNSEILFNVVFIKVLQDISKIGVALFIMISGYVNVKKQFTWKKFWKMEGHIIFYCLFSAIFCYTFIAKKFIPPQEFIKIFLPLTHAQYWFMTVFMILMLMTPYINTFMNVCEKKQLQNGLIVFTIIWTILQHYTTFNYGFNNLTWFILLYCIGAYIKLYVNMNAKFYKKNMILMVLSVILFLGYDIVTFALGKIQTNNDLITKSAFFANKYFLTLIITTTIFIFFVGKQIKQNKVINAFGSCTFSVFLLHDSNYLRAYLWNSLFKCYTVYNTNMLIPHIIFTITTLFISVFIIDSIRKKCIEPLWMKIYDKIVGMKLFSKIRQHF